MDDFWDDSEFYAGPDLTDDMIAAAETSLGYKLPQSYLRPLQFRNGGTPVRTLFRVRDEAHHKTFTIHISSLRGIGGEWGIDSPSLGSRAMIAEWDYPDVGIVIADTPSAGHDTVMLDYSECGPTGEPRVIHVETETAEPRVTMLAPTFAVFVEGLSEG